jgi:hypothetical protein
LLGARQARTDRLACDRQLRATEGIVGGHRVVDRNDLIGGSQLEALRETVKILKISRVAGVRQAEVRRPRRGRVGGRR